MDLDEAYNAMHAWVLIDAWFRLCGVSMFADTARRTGLKAWLRANVPGARVEVR